MIARCSVCKSGPRVGHRDMLEGLDLCLCCGRETQYEPFPLEEMSHEDREWSESWQQLYDDEGEDGYSERFKEIEDEIEAN